MLGFQSRDNLDPSKIPTFPRRPYFDTDPIIYTRTISAIDAAFDIDKRWNRWADRTDCAFRILNKHSKNLDLTDEDYIGFIAMVSRHPDRPQLTPGMTYENGPEDMGTDVERIPLFEFLMSWDSYAEILEATYTEIAKELSRRKVDMDKVNAGLSHVSFDARSSTEAQMSFIFTAMLGSNKQDLHEDTAPSSNVFEQHKSSLKRTHDQQGAQDYQKRLRHQDSAHGQQEPQNFCEDHQYHDSAEHAPGINVFEHPDSFSVNNDDQQEAPHSHHDLQHHDSALQVQDIHIFEQPNFLVTSTYDQQGTHKAQNHNAKDQKLAQQVLVGVMVHNVAIQDLNIVDQEMES